jgi:serralysin
MDNSEATELNQQTYLVSGQSIEIIENSGTSYIDSMLNNAFGSPIKWVSDPYLNAEYSVNGSTVITYSFPGLLGTTALFNYTDDVGEIVAVPFSAQQAADTRLALAKISEFINVTFVEVEEVGDAVGSIRFGINTITDEEGNYREGIGATADPPGPDPRGGDVWFNKNSVKSQFLTGLVELDVQSYTPFGDTVGLYHEIFHTLGVEHPGDHPTIPFPEGKNSTEYTVMAPYTPEDKQLYITDEKIYIVVATPMVYDIAAIQYLYGANMTHNSGDTTYSFDPDTPFIEALWDAGGNDTLDFSNFSKSNTISLVDGEYSTIGFDVDWSMTDNLGIAFDAIIENAIGGSGSDTIKGNSSRNNIEGGAGNDIIDGGLGIDTAIYNDTSSTYTLTSNTDGSISVVHSPASDSVANEGTDTLTNVEYMKFSDKTVSKISLEYSLSSDTDPSQNVLTAHSETTLSGTLNFNAGNNVIILDGQATTYRGLEGDDTYFVSQLLPKNSKISITDTSGDNTIQLPANTYIDKSLFTKNAAQLTLLDGREVTISGADKFTYNVGGNITNGTDGIDLTFREFADVFGVYDILNTSGAQTGTISDMYII